MLLVRRCAQVQPIPFQPAFAPVLHNGLREVWTYQFGPLIAPASTRSFIHIKQQKPVRGRGRVGVGLLMAGHARYTALLDEVCQSPSSL